MPDPDREHSRVGHARDAKSREDDDPGDERGGEISEHVAGHGLPDVAQDLVDALGALGPHPVENAADHAWRLEEDEERQHADGDEGDDPAHDRLADGQGGPPEAADQCLEPRHVLLDIAL